MPTVAKPAPVRGNKSKDDAANSLFHQCDVEVQKQPKPHSGKLQIGQYLRFVNRQKFFYRFELDHDAMIGDEVQAETRLNCNAFVGDRHANLPFVTYATLSQFDTKTLFVNRFQQTGPRAE